MLHYATAKQKPKHFLALTSSDVAEFEFLLSDCTTRADRYFRYHTWQGKKRKLPRFTPQADQSLADPADQLFFLLVYLKNKPLQAFQAALFGISQGWGSQRVHRLLALLNERMSGLGLSPCQDSDSLRAQLDRLKPPAVNLEATEREVPRSVDQSVQREEFSGKARTHTCKNQPGRRAVLCDDRGYEPFLSLTDVGKVHDKAQADAEGLVFPLGQVLRQDTGYQGYGPAGAVIVQPLKKPRNGELSTAQKARNQAISAKRVVVEHAINGIKPHRRPGLALFIGSVALRGLVDSRYVDTGRDGLA